MSKVDAQWGVAGKELRGTLPAGTRLRGYELLSVLGQGAFGITYLAHDTVLDRDVAIKEYLPVSLAVREDGTTVMARSTALEAEFVWGRNRFLDEARTLARLGQAPAIVHVHDFLEANGTAYMIMALARGEALSERLARGDRLDRMAVDRMLACLLDGLEEVHAAGFLHRDIKPANIVLDAANNPTLIDFGAARAAMAGRTAAMTAIFTPGYAAPEQFSSSRQGPWTDIYGLAATLYCAITGTPPPNAVDRLQDDAYKPLGRLRPPGFSQPLLSGIDAGLATHIGRRPQSVAEWRELLRRQDFPLADHATTVVMPRRAAPTRPERSRHGRRALWVLAGTVLAVVLIGVFLNGSLPSMSAIRTAMTGESPSTPAPGRTDATSAATASAETVESNLNLTTTDRRRIQVALTALGFDTYGSDGMFGRRSREMIAAWQKARNRPSTGFLDDAQRQALLKEAAAIGGYGAASRKSDDESRKSQGTGQADATAAPPALPTAAAATSPSPSVAVSTFDGSYTGSFVIYSTSSAATVVARASIKVTLGHGSGLLAFEGGFGSGGGTVSIDISPDGTVTGEGEATEPNGLRNRFAIRGHAEDKRLKLELKGLSKDSLSMTLHRTPQEP